MIPDQLRIQETAERNEQVAKPATVKANHSVAASTVVPTDNAVPSLQSVPLSALACGEGSRAGDQARVSRGF